MFKIDTDKQKIDEILNRSVAEILPSKEEFRKLLLSGKRIKFYIGTDPTGTSLHLGHATNYIVLERLRKLGHEAIFLIGDFTATIGDPSDKKALRQQLKRDEIKTNIQTWLKQISPIVDLKDKENPVKILYNYDWLAKLNFEDLINIASNFTVQQMIERDMFNKRLKEDKPIYLHEFFYPLMQGYDSVAMEVDMELCGNDQKFNALAGRTLLRKMKNKEKFVFITTLLENPITKEKMMSKSLKTGIFLDETADNMFGQVMAQADENIYQLFIDCTYVELEEIEKIKKDLKTNKVNPKDIKMRLAEEITKIYHGKDLAKLAKENFINTIVKKQTPKDVNEIFFSEDSLILDDILIKANLANSKAEAKRLCEQGGVKLIDNEKSELKLNSKEKIKLNSGIIIQKGKRAFIKIKK